MPPAEHLIERAAALLNTPPRPAPAPAGEAGAAMPGIPSETPAQLLAPSLGLPTFVPLPPTSPVLVQPHPALGGPAAAALELPAPPVQPAVLPGTPRQAPAGLVPLRPPAISVESLQAAGMVVARGARNRIAEEYRVVLGRVLRALREEPDGRGLHNLLMVTSAKPGEGKSFTSLNLAASVAQHTADKVLLIDLDAKLRPLTTLLGAAEDRGFYELVADPSIDPLAVIRPTALPNLDILPVGHRSAGEDGRGDVHPITSAITRIARQFADRVVILDAPPCLSTSDPSTIAPIVGQIVMVIEAERTQRSEVESALELVRVCPVITMLLNKVQLTTSHTFGAYDYYGNYS